MNLIIFDRSELSEGCYFELTGERASYLRDLHRPKLGDLFRVGELGGKVGFGQVTELDDSHIRFAVELTEESSTGSGISLILALPRPQMLKRIFEAAAAIGVADIALIQTERVEKSYFSSPLLTEGKMKQHLLAGLEQGISTVLPRVSIHQNFKHFVGERIYELFSPDALKLLAHPAARDDLAELSRTFQINPTIPVLLAIGPEGGFRDQEVEAFEKIGFRSFNMGPRILRVETAVPAVCAQIALLRKLNLLENA